MTFRLHPLAEQELHEGVAYYHAISPKLGLAFTQSVYEAIQQAVSFPNAWTSVTPNIRRVLTHKFPYSVLYQQHNQQVFVLAIMNLNRKPNYWHDRTEYN
jgi:toxin ParE1/3/4